MKFFQPHLVAIALGIVALAVVSVLAGEDEHQSATDKASGVTVNVFRDEVVVKRSATSTSGTDGASGQVACTNDYNKLINAQAQPSLDEPWYAASLISWPAAGKESTARLSHDLGREVDLCVASTTDSS